MTVALVTGGAKRIGRELVLCLAARGYDIVLHHGTAADAAGRTRADCLALGRQCWTVAADLSDPAAAVSLWEQALRLAGRVDVLVHNASPFLNDRLETFTLDNYALHRGVICDAAVILSQHFARQDFAPQQGLIVTMLDSALRHPQPGFLSYTLAKSALLTLTRILAVELAPRIRVNGIAPGPTLPAPTQRDSHFQQMVNGTPLRTSSTPADLCRVLELFLMVPAMTGEVIAVDGGRSLSFGQ